MVGRGWFMAGVVEGGDGRQNSPRGRQTDRVEETKDVLALMCVGCLGLWLARARAGGRLFSLTTTTSTPPLPKIYLPINQHRLFFHHRPPA